MQRGYHLNAATAGDLQKSLNEVSYPRNLYTLVPSSQKRRQPSNSMDVYGVTKIGPKFNSDPLTATALIKMATNPMKPAIYFAAGTLEKQEAWRHYALNIPYYTHFTSPIRRYADVMVHRVLTAVLNDQVEELGLSIFDIEDILEHCNEKKTKSKEAQDRCDHTFFCLYLDGKDLTSEACVVDWGEKSFELFIPEYGVTKRVHVDDLKCNIKTKEDGFVLSPLKTASPSREIKSADSSAKESIPSANNDEANVKSPPQQAVQEDQLVPDSRLRVLEKNEKDKALESLDDDMRKLTVVQANLDVETDDNEALPKFRSGSDIPVFMLPNELTGIVEEVPAEVLGRGTKAGVNVIYVRDLNGKKAEMMLPSMNNFVEATNSTKKSPRRNHNGKRVEREHNFQRRAHEM